MDERSAEILSAVRKILPQLETLLSQIGDEERAELRNRLLGLMKDAEDGRSAAIATDNMAFYLKKFAATASLLRTLAPVTERVRPFAGGGGHNLSGG